MSFALSAPKPNAVKAWFRVRAPKPNLSIEGLEKPIPSSGPNRTGPNICRDLLFEVPCTMSLCILIPHMFMLMSIFILMSMAVFERKYEYSCYS